MPIARVTVPVRDQGEMQFVMPEDALPPEHPARVLWSVLTLWTYAISRGVGSAREVERLTRSDAAYRWIG